MKLDRLTTEARNPATERIDQLPTLEVVKLLNAEDQTVAAAVQRVLPDIARAVDLVVERLARGGRLFYVGAGTSGRLGVLDASECPPTFGTPPALVQGLIAGGRKAVFHSQEGAEDVEGAAIAELVTKRLRERDVVVAISASGRTPYAIGGLTAARGVGAAAIAVTCNADSEMARHADVTIAAVVGPEAILGSTRMKAGTAQKMVLNMLSTATMVRLGRVRSNLMIDLQLNSDKLHRRAVRLVTLLTGVSETRARAALTKANGNVRTAADALTTARNKQR